MSKPAPKFHTVDACAETPNGYLLRLIAPTGTARSSSPFKQGDRVRVSGGMASRA